MRRWGVPSTNRECEETETRILRETSFIYGGEFESKWKNTVAKSVVGWCVEQSTNVEPTQERAFGLWMHRLKRIETLERERKETEREEKQLTDQAPIRPTTQVNRHEPSANQTVIDQGVERMQQWRRKKLVSDGSRAGGKTQQREVARWEVRRGEKL